MLTYLSTLFLEKECLPRGIWKIFLLLYLLTSNCSSEEIAIYIALFKEFRDVFAWSYEEMAGIYPSIVEHEIQTYLDAKPVRQKLRPINLRKAAAVKEEVEKLLKAGFIYPIALT